MPQPILFNLAGPRVRARGVPPPMHGCTLLPQTRLVITGVSRDGAGAVVPACTVTLYRTADKAPLETVTSDAVTGAYAFSSIGPAEAYFIIAYLPGAPDIAGTTVNTLEGVAG